MMSCLTAAPISLDDSLPQNSTNTCPSAGLTFLPFDEISHGAMPIPKVEGANRSCYFATFSPAPSSCGPAMVRVFSDCAKTARPVLTKGLFSSAAWVTMKWEPKLGSCDGRGWGGKVPWGEKRGGRLGLK